MRLGRVLGEAQGRHRKRKAEKDRERERRARLAGKQRSTAVSDTFDTRAQKVAT